MSFSSSDTSFTEEEKLVPSEPMFEMVQVARCLSPALVGPNRVNLRDDDPAFTERINPDIFRVKLEWRKPWLGNYVTVRRSEIEQRSDQKRNKVCSSCPLE
jgi:hypothetical protein